MIWWIVFGVLSLLGFVAQLRGCEESSMRVSWPEENTLQLTEAFVVTVQATDPEFRKRYFDFLTENNIFGLRGFGSSGLGRCTDVYRLEDAPKIKEFLRAEFPEFRIP